MRCRKQWGAERERERELLLIMWRSLFPDLLYPHLHLPSHGFHVLLMTTNYNYLSTECQSPSPIANGSVTRGLSGGRRRETQLAGSEWAGRAASIPGEREEAQSAGPFGVYPESVQTLVRQTVACLSDAQSFAGEITISMDRCVSESSSTVCKSGSVVAGISQHWLPMWSADLRIGCNLSFTSHLS